MSLYQWFLVAAAAVVALFGPASSLLASLRRKRVASYQEAMLALAVVRSRMAETGGVPDDAGKAIEVITHALVEGSDR